MNSPSVSANTGVNDALKVVRIIPITVVIFSQHVVKRKSLKHETVSTLTPASAACLASSAADFSTWVELGTTVGEVHLEVFDDSRSEDIVVNIVF